MPEKTMKIRFIQDRVVKDHDGNVIDTFRAGQVKELAEASARHWINRGVAVEIQGKDKGGAGVPAGRQEKPAGPALVSAIVGVIDALDPNEDFTQAGIPSLGALERALGYPVNSGEREDAWQAHLAAQDAARNAGGKAGGNDTGGGGDGAKGAGKAGGKGGDLGV